MKVEVSIDPACKEPKVTIHTDKMTDEIENLMQCIASAEMNTLSVLSHRGVEFINCEDIVRIYTEQKKVFVQTMVSIYNVRFRLYELEEKLNTQLFLRISNAEIVNRNMIIHMDISKTGTIGVELKGGIKTYASRRYVTKIKKQLGL
ncbi:LytTR family transcriptional regulator [Lysinibacillus xylanilyticus]|uniref:LytTR family DNA-binding domain-containing protein n=1 Tax=Lysinibacillus xylanilyticus TaxID=582475 RepID=UPI002B24C166|nr:LytTR family DNA-binding domain-containing protein [Lysinibacillus xylanilyticus]MEB2299738.1 LytTR family transcriptional regulator [Lysinibacillus xylanilyticus]